jgi:hypothetical protein
MCKLKGVLTVRWKQLHKKEVEMDMSYSKWLEDAEERDQ